jgi:hypothetical protein
MPPDFFVQKASTAASLHMATMSTCREQHRKQLPALARCASAHRACARCEQLFRWPWAAGAKVSLPKCRSMPGQMGRPQPVVGSQPGAAGKPLPQNDPVSELPT